MNDIKKIARIGWRVYCDDAPPEQSLCSFREAYNIGFRILLCDVRFTLDGVAVCLHDETINSEARNKDGSNIENDVFINKITYEEANKYDFGIKKGIKYRDTKILLLKDFISLCRELDCIPHLELKDTPNRKQCDFIISLLKEYEFNNDVMFNGACVETMQYIANALPNAIMGKWVGNITDELIDEIALYGTKNKKFIYV